jgi:hypothetical protein
MAGANSKSPTKHFFHFQIFFMILSGRLVDQNGDGLDQVNIQIATREGLALSSQVWQSDNDGYFAIDLPLSIQPALLFTRAAYEKTLIQPEDFYNGIYITLSRTGELTEVTVTATVKKKLTWFEWLAIFGISGKVIYEKTK